jgi:predicted MPP superfamily phosphohydrolase
MNDHILHNLNPDGIDRRGFLKCMAWAGTGVLWTVSGGILASKTLAEIAKAAGSLPSATDLSFLQISDSHIGFNKEANKDVIATLQKAIAKLNALPKPPDFILHTGDLSHLSEAEEFDALEQNLKQIRTGEIFYVPGEHDVLSDNGAMYRERFGKETLGSGWYRFRQERCSLRWACQRHNIREGGLESLARNNSIG